VIRMSVFDSPSLHMFHEQNAESPGVGLVFSLSSTHASVVLMSEKSISKLCNKHALSWYYRMCNHMLPANPLPLSCFYSYTPFGTESMQKRKK